MSTSSVLNILRTIIPPILSFELFLGGQARITSLLTPRLYKKAMSKAVGTRDAFYPIIAIKDPTLHSNFIGVWMCIAGALVAYRPLRVPWGAALTLVLTNMGIYSQRRMKIPYWLPVVNTVLSIAMWVLETNTF
ncbi:hypothetical protein K491DRAFT_719146 [Lophiostoma macrostomum CBS 122681]|uniref:Uncharacterized protein n=1 Tax=Lophiostoma macrostomum CBS 122681 TaxID=1314788 RepID=A0A6A6T027_9PLEO|nr:hypothetical protein K491DRAFT_719146 [Lophiostoma macrostomum CBS 122681]